MTDLLSRAARYVAVPSISGDEAELAAEIERELRAAAHLDVRRIGDNVVARTTGAQGSRIVVAGHLDTVPGDPAAARVHDDVLVGLGACDMKGSIAVMVDLATATTARAHEVTWVFYAREEIARASSGLLEIAAHDPGLLMGDAAVVCEPTAGVVEAGCQGVVRVRLVLRGARAHTARPWRGRNAIHRLAAPIAAAAAYAPRSVTIDDVTYTEQLQAVAVTGGVGGNVVPDEATLTVSLRVAPDHGVDDAIAELHARFDASLEAGDAFEVDDTAQPAPPGLAHPVLARLVALTGESARAKLGYTDVATFAAMGIPAANFGAGDPELAHHADERVDRAALQQCSRVLGALLDDE